MSNHKHNLNKIDENTSRRGSKRSKSKSNKALSNNHPINL